MSSLLGFNKTPIGERERRGIFGFASIIEINLTAKPWCRSALMESERCGVTNCGACHSSCYCDQSPLVSGVWSATPRVTASSRHRQDEARRIDVRSVPPGPGAATWISTPHGGRTSIGTAETGQDHSNTSSQHRRDKPQRIDIWSVRPDPEDAAVISTPHGGRTSWGTAATGQGHSNDGARRPLRHAPVRSRLDSNAARRSTPAAGQAE